MDPNIYYNQEIPRDYLSIIALLDYTMRNDYETFSRIVLELDDTEFSYISNLITSNNYYYDDLLDIIRIFENAFQYILINNYIRDYLDGDQISHNQLMMINEEFPHIIEMINQTPNGDIIMRNILN